NTARPRRGRHGATRRPAGRAGPFERRDKAPARPNSGVWADFCARRTCHRIRDGCMVQKRSAGISMDLKFLDFEQPIAELEAKIDALRFVGADSDINISEEIDRLTKKRDSVTRGIFASLTPWQVVQLARHPQRPDTLYYIEQCFTDFQELHGDRMFAEDRSLICGLARLEGRPVALIGHEKGRDTKERIERNYGMTRP